MPRRLTLPLAVAIFVLTSMAAAAPASAACDRFAAVSGSDSAGAGTAASPWRTPTKLVNALAPGETGCLQSGTYGPVGTYALDARTPGATGRPVTLRSAPGGRATVAGPVVLRDTADHVTLDALNIVGNRNQYGTVQMYGSDQRVSGSDVTNKRLHGSCFIVGETYTPQTATRPSVTGNVIHDCGEPGNQLDHAVYVQDTSGGSIDNNVIYGQSGYGIHIYPHASGTAVSHNVVDAAGAVRSPVIIAGGGRFASSNVTVEHNVLVNAARNGTAWPGIYRYGPFGTGNVARFNCMWANAGGMSAPNDAGYAAYANLTADPQFQNARARDYRMALGSPCTTKGPLSIQAAGVLNR